MAALKPVSFSSLPDIPTGSPASAIINNRRRSTKSKPKWVADSESGSCLICKDQFWFFNRRHHCRRCGILCCDACSMNRMRLSEYYGCGDEPVRVCRACFTRASVDDSGGVEAIGKPVILNDYETSASAIVVIPLPADIVPLQVSPRTPSSSSSKADADRVSVEASSSISAASSSRPSEPSSPHAVVAPPQEPRKSNEMQQRRAELKKLKDRRSSTSTIPESPDEKKELTPIDAASRFASLKPLRGRKSILKKYHQKTLSLGAGGKSVRFASSPERYSETKQSEAELIFRALRNANKEALKSATASAAAASASNPKINKTAREEGDLDDEVADVIIKDDEDSTAAEDEEDEVSDVIIKVDVDDGGQDDKKFVSNIKNAKMKFLKSAASGDKSDYEDDEQNMTQDKRYLSNMILDVLMANNRSASVPSFAPISAAPKPVTPAPTPSAGAGLGGAFAGSIRGGNESSTATIEDTGSESGSEAESEVHGMQES